MHFFDRLRTQSNHSYLLGNISQSCCSYRVSHTQSRHVVRQRTRPPRPQTRLHQTQLGFRQGFTRVGGYVEKTRSR